jgi:hypothetical protein
MVRRFTQSMFSARSRNPRRWRCCLQPVAALESLEDRALLSASCVTSCAAACAPTRCTPSPCSPTVALCKTGAICFSIEKVLCAIQKFEQTLCQSSSGNCQTAPTCDPCEKSCDGGGKTCDSNSGDPCHASTSECSTQPTCGTSGAAG